MRNPFQDLPDLPKVKPIYTNDPELVVENFLYKRWARDWQIMANALNRGIERYLYEGEQEEILLKLRAEYQQLHEQIKEEEKSLKGVHNG